MNKLILLGLLTACSVLTLSAQHRFQTRKNVPTDSIRLSDPAVLADKQSGLYYMTGTGGMIWRSTDLQCWEGPFHVTEFQADSWMGEKPMIWAAELHQTGDGWYYYFATFTNQAVKIDTVRGNVIERRASQVLRADNPMGPYRPFGDATYLPAHRPTLDGTYWKDRDGKPYMVFCGEWLQNWNGTIEKIELKHDLSGTLGEPKVLFRASDSPWSREKDEQGNVTWNKVTDGPWLFRTGSGRLGMLWTSWVFDVYTQGVAYSTSGTLDGPWIQEPAPITPPGYGHAMLFQRFDGQWMMSVHHHSKDARGRTVRIPHFFEVDLSGDKLVVKPTIKDKDMEKGPRTIRSGELWLDDGGRHINAHGGGILKHGDTYYWFGEHKSERTSNALVGVMCYASKDLLNWRNCGVALSVSTEHGSDIERDCIMERPKVIYNKVTGKFCMWFHLELKGQGYNAARYGVAVADRPEGPYQFLYSQRANAGKWPVEFGEQQLAVIDTLNNDNYKEWWTPAWRKAVDQGLIVKRDFDTGQMARDMTLYVDDDGKAYHIFSSEENLTLHIAELTDDYLHHTGRYTRVAPAGHNEAPAIFKHEGTYWMITSGCTGWEPNEARMFSAPSIWGPWTQHPNPCQGPKAEKTFNGQSTFVLTLDDNNLTNLKSRFIFMADIWRPRNPIDARYIWLPIEFENDKPVIRWKDEWSPSLPALDANHLLLDGSLTPYEAAAQPFVYNDFREAVAHFSDTTTLYIRPGVYWVDDPFEPEVVRGENGREPFGCIIHGKVLRFIGLDSDARNIVLASARGQTQGAVGNFTMFDIWCDSLQVENMTLGNFCNVDLDYPLNDALSRKKRSDVITQAHIGYVHGQSMRASNVRFISRLNLNPLNGAKSSYYENCHFECTDDALNGTAVYRHCDFDFYGTKPFWSTFGSGALFVDCDFYAKGVSREMFFCKQGGPVTVIDCRYHAPTDSLYIGWTPYPQRWLRCHQKNFTLNGKPYVIGKRSSENTIVMDSIDMRKDRPPYLHISQHEAELQVDGEPLTLTVAGEGRQIVWRTHPLLTLNKMEGDSVTVRLACDQIDSTLTIPVTACAVGDNPAVAVCMVTIQPPLLPSPTFLEEPNIRIENGVAYLDYQLDLRGHSDHSFIAWSRLDEDDCHKEAHLSWSNDGPQRQYRLRPGDVGRRLMVTIRPAHDRSLKGSMTEVASKLIEESDLFTPLSPWRGVGGEAFHLETDFSDIHCGWSDALLPDTWCADGYKPADTAEYDWHFDSTKPMWEYGEGFNGAVGKGLLQAQRGARLRYTPAPRSYGDMALTLLVDPTKTAGQGFGSATGQYMDVCLKFDTQTLTGYGLRIIRTVKHAKAVDFLLVEYNNGQVTPLTDPVTATCYRTHCTITLTYTHGLLSAQVKTTSPSPSSMLPYHSNPPLPNSVTLSASVKPNPFGGIHIQHTGSCGESTTMLHRLDVSWGKGDEK